MMEEHYRTILTNLLGECRCNQPDSYYDSINTVCPEMWHTIPRESNPRRARAFWCKNGSYIKLNLKRDNSWDHESLEVFTYAAQSLGVKDSSKYTQRELDRVLLWNDIDLKNRSFIRVTLFRDSLPPDGLEPLILQVLPWIVN